MKNLILLFVTVFIFSLNVNAQTWPVLPYTGTGYGMQICVDNSNGKVWILGMGNGIFSHNGSGWVQYPGNGTGLDITVYKGVPYVIGTNNAIYKGTGTTWEQLPGNGSGKRITCEDNNGIWVIGTNDRIYSFTGSTWLEEPGGGLGKDIAVFGDTPYVIGVTNLIHKYQ